MVMDMSMKEKMENAYAPSLKKEIDLKHNRNAYLLMQIYSKLV